MRKKVWSIISIGFITIILTGCGSSNSNLERAVKEFVECEYNVDLQCIVTSIDYSGALAYKKTNSNLNDFWDKYDELENKNTNAIVLENAKKNYKEVKNLYNQYDAKVTKTQIEELSKDIYKVKTTTNIKDKDRTWDNIINYIVIKKNDKYSVIEMTADDRAIFVLSSTIEKMTKGLKYEDGTLINY